MKLSSFRADNNLLFLIQQTTGHPSADILSYFHGCVVSMMEAVKKSKARRPKVRLNRMYPGTNIPFTMELSSGWRSYSDPIKEVYCSLQFPRNPQKFGDITQIANEIAESELLGTVPPIIPRFPEPEKKAPRSLRKALLSN